MTPILVCFVFAADAALALLGACTPGARIGTPFTPIERPRALVRQEISIDPVRKLTLEDLLAGGERGNPL